MDNELYLSNKNEQKNKQTKKSKEKKAISKRCVISRAGIDDRVTVRSYDGSSSFNEESRRHDSARSLKNSLIFSSSVGPDLEEEWELSEKSQKKKKKTETIYLAAHSCSELHIENPYESLRINHDYPQQKTSWVPSATQYFRIYPQFSQR